MHASPGSIAGHMAPTTPTTVDQSSLTYLMMAGKFRNELQKAKYRKEKQTDSSAPPSIAKTSILLAHLPDRGHSATPAGQTRASGMMTTSQNRNMWSAYTDVPIFLAQKNTITKRHDFYYCPLYTDTVPLSLLLT